jgi:hypothetical protein
MEDLNKYDKYRGLSREEANRQMAEDERRTIREDPLVIAARKAAEERHKQAVSRCYSLTYLLLVFSDLPM